MPPGEQLEVDVAIVGGGLAGLTAAHDLAAEGQRVAVLEARDRVGGRTLNHSLGGGEVVELGGQWIGPGQDRIADLATKLGIATFPTYNEGRHLFDWRGRKRRYRGRIPPLNPAVLVDFERTRRKLDRLARGVPPEAPWNATDANRLDSMTVRTWMDRHMWTKGAKAIVELAVEAVWAAEPEELSLLHALFYIRSAGRLDLLLDTAGGAQQDRFVGGSQLVAIRLAERLGDQVVLGAPVRAIAWSSGRVQVRADGVVVDARSAIVAVPPPLAARIAYDPPLPGYRDQLTQRMPLGTVIKSMAVYDEPFWRAEGLTGQAASDSGPIRFTFDNSPPDGSPGVLLGFFEGRNARLAGQLDPGERRETALGCFARMFGPRAARPVDYIEHQWAEEEWSRGCYGCHLPPGAWTGYGPALRAPIGPISWAGSETATIWNGYMDGAVESGKRAAREVLARLQTGLASRTTSPAAGGAGVARAAVGADPHR